MTTSGSARDLAFLLAPGAGAPSSHPRMQTFARILSRLGSVHPFDYPYMIAGRKTPDRLPCLIDAHRAAFFALRQIHSGPIVLIGKSMGGRVGCHLALQELALEEKVEALVCLGYPLCGGGDASKLRDQVLLDLKTPAMFVQGTRDALCPLANHRSFRPTRNETGVRLGYNPCASPAQRSACFLVPASPSISRTRNP